MITSAIILAGGQGTRLRGIVADLPKPMAPVAGRPFLQHLIDYWISQGILHFVLSVGYLSECIEEHFGSAYRGAKISYAVEPRPLGTGGGLLLAERKLFQPGPCLVLNGDTFFPVTLAELAGFHSGKRARITMSVANTESSTRYTGVRYDAGHRVTEIAGANACERQMANGGVYLVERMLLDAAPYQAGETTSLESDILVWALNSGEPIYAFPCGGPFIDIGTPEDYARASTLLGADGMAEWADWARQV